jgi:hypothetical protein
VISAELKDSTIPGKVGASLTKVGSSLMLDIVSFIFDDGVED